MKLIIFFAFFALAFAQGPPPPQYQLHIPDKCEDVLAVKVCERLRNTAKALKLKSEQVEAAVKDAYQKGKTTAVEIKKSVEEFLFTKVLNKKCEDLTTAENCDKLRDLAKQLKVQADKVQEFIVKEIANLKTKTCEDFLEVSDCKKLEDLAKKLKIKAEKLKDVLMEAYLKAKTEGTERVAEAYNKIRDYVVSTRCEDMFNPDLCNNFRKFAEKTKVALPRIMKTAYNLVRRGVAIGKDFAEKVYNIVDYFYDCTDIFDESSCKRLKAWAAKLKVTAQEVEIAVKKYVRIAIEKGTSIYKTIKEFVKNKIYCRFTKKCVNAEDADEIADLAINKRSIFGDWRNKIRQIINDKFPNLEADIRQKLEEVVATSKSFFEFMKKMADKIKNTVSDKYNEFFKKLMVEATL